MYEIQLPNWETFKQLINSKKLLLQFVPYENRYELYAGEGPFIWRYSLTKSDINELIDFETNYKTVANKPLEYRSRDGLQKIASSKFTDQLSFWLDGTVGNIDVPANSSFYMKKHFDFPYILSGVDVHWYDANWGDKLDFCIGIYTDLEDENSFICLNQFAIDYYIYKNGSRVIDIFTVITIPPTINFHGNTYDVYIRVKCENVGPNSSKVLIRLIGWR